jgi:hypothetical protein
MLSGFPALDGEADGVPVVAGELPFLAAVLAGERRAARRMAPPPAISRDFRFIR